LLSLERQADCGELDEIAWVDMDEALALDLPNVTRFVLQELALRLEDRARRPWPPRRCARLPKRRVSACRPTMER
jgi:8-oxo-dGTP pyrophosphatase MutT (NUDIX family)